MKEIHYISIQGKDAPAFWFKNHEAHHFRSMVESITLSQSLIIPSIYRSDLFFYSENDLSDLMIKTWCVFKGKPYSNFIKGKFIRSTDLISSFEFYFDTLFHLMLHPSHYDRYRKRLNEIHGLEQNNNILNKLMQCNLYLAKSYKEQNIAYRKLSTPTSVKGNKMNYTDFKLLARQGIKESLNN